MFCLKATLLSEILSTIWGTNSYKLIDGILKIYYNIFKEISATLKFTSPSNLIKRGTIFFIMISKSISSFEIWNFVCNYSIASSLIFQSLSFLRSYSIFLPRICYNFYCLTFCWRLVMGGNKTLDYLLKLSLSGFLIDRRFNEYCNYFPAFTPAID